MYARSLHISQSEPTCLDQGKKLAWEAIKNSFCARTNNRISAGKIKELAGFSGTVSFGNTIWGRRHRKALNLQFFRGCKKGMEVHTKKGYSRDLQQWQKKITSILTRFPLLRILQSLLFYLRSILWAFRTFSFPDFDVCKTYTVTVYFSRNWINLNSPLSSHLEPNEQKDY